MFSTAAASDPPDPLTLFQLRADPRTGIEYTTLWDPHLFATYSLGANAWTDNVSGATVLPMEMAPMDVQPSGWSYLTLVDSDPRVTLAGVLAATVTLHDWAEALAIATALSAAIALGEAGAIVAQTGLLTIADGLAAGTISGALTLTATAVMEPAAIPSANPSKPA